MNPQLTADCSSCFGLCCAALPLTVSADFPIDKAAGVPCHNLQDDFRCGIHERLREEGWRGCTVFDCFGAGQQISQVTYAGRNWREHPETAGQMFALLPVMRQLHEMLFHLTTALGWSAATPVHPAVAAQLETTSRLVDSSAEALLALDLGAYRGEVGAVLRRTSEVVRLSSGAVPSEPGPGADLMGADLRGRDLRRAELRGAYLIAADLRGVDLTCTDLLGADLRDADLRGADLSASLFLTQSQLNATRGDASTTWPSALDRPDHWA